MRITLVWFLAFALSLWATGCDESQLSSFMPKGSPTRVQAQQAAAQAQLAAEAQAQAGAAALADAEEWTTNETMAATAAPAANLEEYADAARQQVEAFAGDSLAQSAQEVEAQVAQAAHTHVTPVQQAADYVSTTTSGFVTTAESYAANSVANTAPSYGAVGLAADIDSYAANTANAVASAAPSYGAVGLAADIDSYAANAASAVANTAQSYGAVGLAADIDSYAAQMTQMPAPPVDYADAQSAASTTSYGAVGLAADIDSYAANASQNVAAGTGAAQVYVAEAYTNAYAGSQAATDTAGYAYQDNNRVTDEYIPSLPGTNAESEAGYEYTETPSASLAAGTFTETYAAASDVVHTTSQALPMGEDYIREADLLPGPLSMSNE